MIGRPKRVRFTPVSSRRFGTIMPSAECYVCDWKIDRTTDRSWSAVREAARRHVASTGHVAEARPDTRYVLQPSGVSRDA